jgi:hypothetical protein
VKTRTLWILAGTLILLGARPSAASAGETCRLCELPERIASDAGLLARAAKSPHALFRLLSLEFAQSVCLRFGDVMASLPSVNLHGDPHLEQFAVTRDTAGLVDFDDSSTGPGLIDLTRFVSSLLIGCDQRGWPSSATETVDQFFAGYRAALADPAIENEEPGVAKRLRSGFGDDRTEFLAWAESIMLPLSEQRRIEIEAGYARYVARMLQLRPEYDATFFEMKSLGGHELGLGSARDAKVIGRIEGPTDAPGDDLILEGKELRDLGPIDCVSARRGDALRVVLAQQRISNRRDPFLAVVPRGEDEDPEDPPFWVQSWSPNYAELDLDDSQLTPDDLAAVAFDVGVQLGRGHTSQIASPFDRDLREAQRRSLDRHESEIRQLATDLARDVSRIWRENLRR